MKLYRLCCQEEIDAIKKDGFDKLTFGGSLFRYVGLRKAKVNSFKNYKALWQDVKAREGEDRIKPILKIFKNMPYEIPLFEKDLLKRKEVCNLFVPNAGYVNKCRGNQFISDEIFEILNSPSEKYDEIFLLSIKLACFFDDISTINKCCEELLLNSECRKILTIDFPKEVAVQYKGKGIYNVCHRVPEYALPMYLLKPEHIDNFGEFKVDEEKEEKLKSKQYKKIEKDIIKLTKRGNCEEAKNDFLI